MHMAGSHGVKSRLQISLLWLKSDCENDEADTSVEIRLEINKLPGQL
jgi:hypothetical protein